MSSGAGVHFIIAALVIHPYQDVRFISTATQGSSLTFGGDVTVSIASGLMIRGEGSLRAFEEADAASTAAVTSEGARINTAMHTRTTTTF